MKHFAIDDPDIVVIVPLPHVDIAPEDLSRMRDDFLREDLVISFRTEENYPISPSWAEIALCGGAFLAGAAANHYAEKLFDALDRFLKSRFREINLEVTKGGKSIQKDLPRDNRERAILMIKDALNELEQPNDDDPQSGKNPKKH